MTPEQLAEIEARAEAATPAPWYDQITDSGYLRVTIHPEAVNGICGFGDMEDTDGQDHYNAAFIAKAREDVPALIAEIKRLQFQALTWQSTALDLQAELDATIADLDRCQEARRK